jgi:hypothetical protein
MPNGPAEMAVAMARTLPEKTGRSLEDWHALLLAKGPEGYRQRVEWLKREHGLGHSTAEMITNSVDYFAHSPDELRDAQYAGAKAALRPIYDRVAEAVQALGRDAQLDPRKTFVSLRRAQQFGLVQATTRSRVDLGLKLRGVEPSGRLQAAPGFGSGNITHRVGLSVADEVDDEVVGWLRQAYAGVR